MLKQIREDLERYYYDSTYHGIDLRRHFTEADSLVDLAQTNSDMFGVIAQTLLDFDDSHTFFVPPARTRDIEYGWRLAAVGDSVYVAAVQPGSDAERQGVAPGDNVLAINGIRCTRATLWKLEYLFQALRPQTSLRLALVKPDGSEREVDVAARIGKEERVFDLTNEAMRQESIVRSQRYASLMRDQEYAIDSTALVWKLTAFGAPGQDIDRTIHHARNFPALIIDLRGTPGGRLQVLSDLIGGLFDRDVVIGANHRRDTVEVMKAGHARTPFTGRLLVVIDSRSASASEMLARVVQLERRGTVVGDQSAGAVMGAYGIPHRTGTVQRTIPFGVSVTIEDVRMADGQSLEKRGVVPDEIVRPTAADLAAGRDPVLARAAALVGAKLTPEQAGRISPMVWPK
jgi:carboxyl-terminal processing protease